jgi:hypothetical protein
VCEDPEPLSEVLDRHKYEYVQESESCRDGDEEISQLYQEFIGDVLNWLTRATESRVLAVLPLDREVEIAVDGLPARFHGDPADRLIVANPTRAE